MVIPRSLREQAGIAEGTLMAVDIINGGRVLLTPQLTVDRSVLTGPNSNGQALRKLAKVVAELRQEAKQKGLDKMSKREIDAAVSAARRDLKKSRKRALK